MDDILDHLTPDAHVRYSVLRDGGLSHEEALDYLEANDYNN